MGVWCLSMGSGSPSNSTRSSGSRPASFAMPRMVRWKGGSAAFAASYTSSSVIASGAPPPSGACVILSFVLNDGYLDM